MWGRVGGSPEGAKDRGERKGRASLGSSQKEEGRAGGRAGGWAEKISGLSGGDVPGYRTGRRRRGGRMDADPFRYLQYPERMERQVGIGVEGDGTGKFGCGGLPIDQIDRGHLHAEIGRV